MPGSTARPPQEPRDTRDGRNAAEGMPDVAGRILDGQVGQIQARQMAVLPQRGDRRGSGSFWCFGATCENAGMLSWTISACKMAADFVVEQVRVVDDERRTRRQQLHRYRPPPSPAHRRTDGERVAQAAEGAGYPGEWTVDSGHQFRQSGRLTRPGTDDDAAGRK